MAKTEPLLPLSGVKILDATRVLAGPYCSYLLSLLGATVTRVERSPDGDSIRWRSRANPSLGEQGLSTDYVAQAGNKEIIYLDLSKKSDQSRFLQLVRDNDILVENFRNGALGRLGLSKEKIEKHNPSLIWCSITGYGEGGVRSEYPAYDSVIQAASGLMQLTGTSSSGPLKTGAPIVDYTTGLNAALGVVSALLMRRRDNQGSRIKVSMLDTALAMMQSTVSGHLNGQESLAARGNAASSGNPLSKVYEALDGLVCIAINEPHQLRSLMSELGIPPDLADSKKRNELLSRVEMCIRQRTVADTDYSLNTVGVPCAPVQGLDAALGIAVEADAGYVKKMGGSHSLQVLGLPFNIDGSRGATPVAPSAHAERLK